MSYQTLLFDLDHTLIDSDLAEARSLSQVLSIAGLDDTAIDRYRAINTQLWSEVEAGTRRPDEVKVERFRRLLEQTEHPDRESDMPKRLADRFASGLVEHAEFYPGASAVLDAVTGGRRVGLVTNGIGAVQRGRIARLGLDQWFGAFAISGELGVSKPDPEIIDRCLADLNISERHSVVMIGDSLTSDIAGGRAAGVDTCWVDRSGGVVEHGATHRVTALEQLVELVG